MLEVYIVRHGRTAMNKRGMLQGRGTDLPLDEVGFEQAREAGRWAAGEGLRFDRVISSPLQRAVQTACAVTGLPEASVECDDLLLEMDYGPWEGYELSRHDPAVEAFFADFAHAPAPEGMEPLAHVVGRAREFLASLGADDGRVLVSTHAIMLKGCLEALDPAAQGGWWSRYVGNCWVYRSQQGSDGKLLPAECVYDAGGRVRPGV